MPSNNTTELALLLHMLNWKCAETEYPVSNNITLARADNTQAIKLYKYLCESQRVDEGEPAGYSTYALIRPRDEKDSLLDVGDPHSTADRFANICAILSSTPMLFSRAIWSRDGFLTADNTVALHLGGWGTLPLVTRAAVFVKEPFVQELQTAWAAVETNRKTRASNRRVQNALTYFYYAWNSQYLEQTCLNLAIVLETLFAPHSAGESTHQISFNLSRFLGSSPDEREAVYEFFKNQFFLVRGIIVHGDTPSRKHPAKIVEEAFLKVSQILRSILLDKQLLQTFMDEARRRRFLRDFLFR